MTLRRDVLVRREGPDAMFTRETVIFRHKTAAVLDVVGVGEVG